MPSEEALFAHQLALRALAMAKAGLVTSLGLFSLLAALCVSHGLRP